MSESNFILSLYTEITPNPETLKFVFNKMLLPGRSVDFRENDDKSPSPLAEELFKFDYIKGVFISNNFVSLTKSPDKDWLEIKTELSDFLKGFINSGKTIAKEVEVKPQNTAVQNGESNSIDEKIKQMLEQYVKPAVEMDGGAIQFKSFDNGVVTLILQGACSGCPSSTITLKSGIEGLLKRMVPEVTEVVAEDEQMV